MFLHLCACSPLLHLLFVYMGLTAGAPRVASGPPSACTSSPFEALKQGRLGMINGPVERHAPEHCSAPPASSPAVLPPDSRSQPSVRAVLCPHTTHFLSVIYPTYPPVTPPPPIPTSLAPKSIKQLCSSSISSFWLVPSSLLRCRHRGLFTGRQRQPLTTGFMWNKDVILIRMTLRLQGLVLQFRGHI